MDFEKVIRTRRSIRSYADRDIPDEVLNRILESARIAPSGNNRQPWKFIVVKEKELKRKIAEHSYDQSFIAGAPVVIVCCGKKFSNRYEPFGDNAYLVDVIIAIDHLILSARNEGVGSCWVGAFSREPIQKLLKLPKELEVLMVIPLGYPVSESAFGEPRGRKSLEEISDRI